MGDEWRVLEKNYYVMLYLMRSSMRVGKVAPGLWGPFTIVDFSGWSDQMTLDCTYASHTHTQRHIER